MMLLNLAPSIQEAILFLPREDGQPSVLERDVRAVAGEVSWKGQRAGWKKLCPVP